MVGWLGRVASGYVTTAAGGGAAAAAAIKILKLSEQGKPQQPGHTHTQHCSVFTTTTALPIPLLIGSSSSSSQPLVIPLFI